MRRMQGSKFEPLGRIGQALGAIYGLVFLGVGVTVLIFLWSQPDNGFAPPLFFRVMGSFISMAFVAFGFAMCAAAFTAGRLMRSGSPPIADTPASAEGSAPGATSYTCPHCAAPLSDNADVSPRGDVKCGYCKAWFNIHSA